MQADPIAEHGAPSTGVQSIPRAGVAAKLGVSVPQLTRLVRHDPTFPDPVELARGSYRWLVHEVDEWLVSRPRRSVAERAAATTAAATAAKSARSSARVAPVVANQKHKLAQRAAV